MQLTFLVSLIIFWNAIILIICWCLRLLFKAVYFSCLDSSRSTLDRSFQQTVDGSCSGLRVRQVLGEQTQTSQTSTRKEVIPNQGLSCCRVSEPSSTTQFRSYRWSLVETFLSIVMDFFFFSNASKTIFDRCSPSLILVRPPELYIFESSRIDGCNLLTLREKSRVSVAFPSSNGPRQTTH